MRFACYSKSCTTEAMKLEKAPFAGSSRLFFDIPLDFSEKTPNIVCRFFSAAL